VLPSAWVRRHQWRIDRQLLLLVLLGAGWVACYLFGYRTQWRQFLQLKAALAPLQQKADVYGMLIGRWPNPQQEFDQVKQRFQQLKEQSLAGREGIPKAIQQISQVAADTGVVVEALGSRDDFQKSAGQLPEGVVKQVIEVRLRGSYQAFGEFLVQLEKLPTRFTIERLTIQDEQAEPSETVQIHLLLGAIGLS